MATITSPFKGQQIIDVAKTRIGENYVLGSDVPKNDANWHGPWDCAEFVAWSIYQITGQLYGCNSDNGDPSKVDAYTGYFKNDSATLGKKITVDEAAKTPGAIILRYPAPMGHVVISDGKGGTIEAHSHIDGVITSVVNGRRWDIGILIPWIDYTNNTNVIVTPPTTIVYRITKPLTKNVKVGQIQKALTAAGFNTYGIDNIYGPNTANAVSAFQKQKSLLVDGEVGINTAATLGITL